MKRSLSIILVLIMIFTMFVGCTSSKGQSNSPIPDDTSAQNETPEEELKENESVTKEEDEGELEGTTYVSARSITINYDENRRTDTKSNSIVFHSQASDIIALTYDKQAAFSGSVDDVFELLNDGDLFKDISTYAGASFKDSASVFKINVETSNKETVAGHDSVCISGNVVDADGKKCEVYAYTFVIDETPCMLVGLSFGSSASIDSIQDEIDKMALTIREE